MHTDRMPQSPLVYLTADPPGATEADPYPLVVALHGFGADKSDLTGLARVLGPAGYRFIFPDGPRFAFDGADFTARAWYERGGDESPESVRDALAALDGFFTAIRARYRVSAGRVVLLGFSQGGAMALRYGLHRPDLFAGIASLSGSLRRLDDLLPGLPVTRSQPILITHGTRDGVVDVDTGRQAAEFLARLGYRPDYREYEAGHHLTPGGLADLRDWLHATLPPGVLPRQALDGR
jgi:phospholipase/carboxylesterase